VSHELSYDGSHLSAGPGFKDYYERYHLQNFQHYSDFIARHGIISQIASRLEALDLQVLYETERDRHLPNVRDLRQQIIECEETVRGVSAMFFRSEKYLERRKTVVELLKKVLDVKKLANDKDQQWLYKLQCHDPQVIVLCENLDFLRRPTLPRDHRIELWYAGGRNINKLTYADTRGLPIYYSADWDLAGLQIFQSVLDFFPQIVLLKPNGRPFGLVESEHRSLWKHRDRPEALSGLNPALYDSDSIRLIRALISQWQWINEERNSLLKMLQKAGYP
jgi:hypothetical protein